MEGEDEVEKRKDPVLRCAAQWGSSWYSCTGSAAARCITKAVCMWSHAYAIHGRRMGRPRVAMDGCR